MECPAYHGNLDRKPDRGGFSLVRVGWSKERVLQTLGQAESCTDASWHYIEGSRDGPGADFPEYADYFGDGSFLEAISPTEIVIHPTPQRNTPQGRATTTPPAERFVLRGRTWVASSDGPPVEPWVFESHIRDLLEPYGPAFEVTHVDVVSRRKVFAAIDVDVDGYRHSILITTAPVAAVTSGLDMGADPPRTPNARGPILTRQPLAP